MLAFMEIPSASAAQNYLMEMISSDQPVRRTTGARVLDYLTEHPDQAKQILSLFQHEDTRQLAETLFDRVESDYTTTDVILEKLNTTTHPQSAVILNQVIRARGYLNREDLIGLHRLLTSCNPEARHRIEAIRSMLKSPRQQQAALNLLPRPRESR